MNNSELRDQEILYLKKKNEQLVKELIEIRSSRRKDQLDMDFLMRENFVNVEKMNRMKSLTSQVDERSRECLKKLVECSTELTKVLNFVKYMREVDVEYQTLHSEIIEGTPSSRSIDGPSINQSAQNEVQGSSLNLEETQRSIREEMTEGEFTSRGGSRPVQFDAEVQDFEMDETGVDPEETNTEAQQSTTTARNGLSIIEEDPERSSYEEDGGTSGAFQQDARVNFLTKLPQITVRRGERAENHELSGSSVNVEPGSSLETSNLDDSPQDSDSNTTTTVLLSTTERGPASPKSTFIERKSLGSPRPRPVASTSHRNSLSSRASLGNRSRLPSGKELSFIERHSLTRRDSTSDSSTMLNTIKTQASACEEENTINDINDWSRLTDLVKNASTPLQVQNSGRLRSSAEYEENSNLESTDRPGPVVELTCLDFSTHNSSPHRPPSFVYQRPKSKRSGRKLSNKSINDDIQSITVRAENEAESHSRSSTCSTNIIAIRNKKEASSRNEHHSDDDDEITPIVKRRRRNCTLNKRDHMVEEFLERNPGAVLLEDKFGNSLRTRKRNPYNKSGASPNTSVAGSSKNWQLTVELARSHFSSNLSKNHDEDSSDAEAAKSPIQPKHGSRSRGKQKSSSTPNRKKSRAESTDAESNNGRECSNEQENRQSVQDREYASSTESEASTRTNGRKGSRKVKTDKLKMETEPSSDASGRKPRRAAVKNVDYKEPNLNLKLRRK